MGSAKKAVKAVVSAPVKAVKSAVKGDVMGVVNAATNAATFGTVSVNDKSGVVDVAKTTSNVLGQITGTAALTDAINDAQAAQEAQANALIAEQKAAEETAQQKATAARRAYHASDTRTIYTTALGDVAESASGVRRKRTLLGG